MSIYESQLTPTDSRESGIQIVKQRRSYAASLVLGTAAAAASFLYVDNHHAPLKETFATITIGEETQLARLSAEEVAAGAGGAIAATLAIVGLAGLVESRRPNS